MINKINMHVKNPNNEEILTLKENPKSINKKDKKLILSGPKNEKKHRYFISFSNFLIIEFL